MEALCEAVAEVPPLASVVTGFAETHPAELSTRLDEAEAAYADLRGSAPDDIDDEVDKVIDLVDEVMVAVRENPDDREAAAEGIRSVIAEHPEVEEASAALVAYTSENCGIDLDPTPADEPTSSTTDTDPGPEEPVADDPGPEDLQPDGAEPET